MAIPVEKMEMPKELVNENKNAEENLPIVREENLPIKIEEEIPIKEIEKIETKEENLKPLIQKQ